MKIDLATGKIILNESQSISPLMTLEELKKSNLMENMTSKSLKNIENNDPGSGIHLNIIDEEGIGIAVSMSIDDETGLWSLMLTLGAAQINKAYENNDYQEVISIGSAHRSFMSKWCKEYEKFGGISLLGNKYKFEWGDVELKVEPGSYIAGVEVRFNDEAGKKYWEKFKKEWEEE